MIIRADNRTAIRAFRELGLAADATNTRMTRAMNMTGRAMMGVGRAMTTAGAGMAFFGYEAAKSAVTFQSSMERIHTQAQVSQKTVNQLGDAVMKLAGTGVGGYGPTELAKALYHIESVAVGNTVPGLHKVSTAMTVLKVAAQGAAVGGSDLEQTTTALMGAMAAIHAPASKANAVMGMLNATVGAGNMTMPDLVHALGRGVVPAFQNVHLKAQDAMAAIALVADQGTNASSAAAQLATSLHYLAGPSRKASQELWYLHIPPEKFAKDLAGPGGLLRALTDLRTGLKGVPAWEQGGILSGILPQGRGRVLQQILNNLDQFGPKLKAIYDPAFSLDQVYKSWANTMQGKLATAHAKIQTAMTNLGTKLLPIIAKYLPMVVGGVVGLLKVITGLGKPLTTVLVAFTAFTLVFGPVIYGLGRLVWLWGELRSAWIAMKAAGIAAGTGEAAAGAGAATAGGEMVAANGAALTLLRTLGYVAVAYEAVKQAGKTGQAITHHHPSKAALHGGILGALVGGGIGFFMGGPPGAVTGAIAGGASGAGAGYLSTKLYGLGWFSHGKGPQPLSRAGRHQSGGPLGSDDTLFWGSKEEGILNRAAMAGVGGPRGLASLNNGDMGGLLGGLHIQPSAVNLYMDSRLVGRGVVNWSLRSAARGPSSNVGGPMVTGVPVLGN